MDMDCWDFKVINFYIVNPDTVLWANIAGISAVMLAAAQMSHFHSFNCPIHFLLVWFTGLNVTVWSASLQKAADCSNRCGGDQTRA